MRAVHVSAGDTVTVRRVSGLRYVQSLIGEGVYAGIGRSLASERRVLFSVLPCQAAAVRSYLGDSPKSLLTAGLSCCGVPSLGFFSEQASDLRRKLKGRVVAFRFRDKRKNGFSRTMVVEFERLSGEVSSAAIDGYREVQCHYSFGKCDCFDMPCYDCRYTSAGRVSDITLDSYWGIGDVGPSFNVRAGRSALLQKTQAGDSCGIRSEKGSRCTGSMLRQQSFIMRASCEERISLPYGVSSIESSQRGDSPTTLEGTVVCLCLVASILAIRYWLDFGGC